MHLPPGTSKWNKIEHRLFSFITQNWRAKPLVSYRVIVHLIAATDHAKPDSRFCAELDRRSYPKGIVVVGRGNGQPQYPARTISMANGITAIASSKPNARSGCFLTSP